MKQHATHATQLLKEWSSKNGKLLTNYAPMSHFKGLWQCLICKNEWQSTIENRQRGSKCPNCRKSNQTGQKNCAWTGYEEISGKQWNSIIHKNSVEITIEAAWDLFLKQDRLCALTGKELSIENAVLDRIDTTQSFTQKNVQWISKKIHSLKRNLSDSEFIGLCKEVAVHQIKKHELPPPSFKQWAAKKSD